MFKVKLVFDDWRRVGKSIYQTEEGVDLSMRDFHSGTTFDGTIELDEEQEQEFKEALGSGAQPVFWVLKEEADEKPALASRALS